MWLQVEKLVTHGHRVTEVVTSQQQVHKCDVVVLAAGVGVPPLAVQAGCTVPLSHKPAAVLLTKPLTPGILKHMVITDTVFILQVSVCAGLFVGLCRLLCSFVRVCAG